ncbi:MAG: alpha-L-rhamnosidase C-terminal domain-containing protein [Bacteroidota bacterium]
MTSYFHLLIGLFIFTSAGLNLSCNPTLGTTTDVGSATEFQPTEKAIAAGAYLTAQDTLGGANQWLSFQLITELSDDLLPSVPLQLTVDSKYWLAVNGKLIIREGGLKHGPSRDQRYCDQLDLGPHLQAGTNVISILVWHFGKDGFSHQNQGAPFLRIDGPAWIATIPANKWRVRPHPAFGTSAAPHPNYRLPESNVYFDARNSLPDWHFPAELGGSAAPDLASPSVVITDEYRRNWPLAVPLTTSQLPPIKPDLPRPIPQWRNSELLDYEHYNRALPYLSTGDTLIADLPYNAQVTPAFRIKAPHPGMRVELRTDNYRGGGPPNVRTVYLTRAGEQVFETPGWMNGHQLRYYFETGIEVQSLQYRESGYDTDFQGNFRCSNPALNTLWEKAQRTLYLTMRDTYMDCPDRERAQWWGDVVNELGETFYALDRRADLLTAKAIRELMHWQRSDSTIYSPIPSGNWGNELPMQMLASVGYYGIWHYYYNTGDLELLREVYPAVQRYLAIWQMDEKTNLVIPRQGGWTWGDWGDNKDLLLLYNGWYYLALKGLAHMAETLDDSATQAVAKDRMERLAAAFNQEFWQGDRYRSSAYEGETDERGHALAVVSGIALEEYYPAIQRVFAEEYHASPYMEKYVLEALCKMELHQQAIQRMQQRYGPMIESSLTTLWEGWGIGSEGYGGGSYNHAWSGGPLTIMSQFLGGVEALDVGWSGIQLQPAGFPEITHAQMTVPTPKGSLQVDWVFDPESQLLELTVEGDFPLDKIELTLPPGTLDRYRSFGQGQRLYLIENEEVGQRYRLPIERPRFNLRWKVERNY